MQWGQWFILANVSCFQYCQKLLSGLWESKVCDAILYFSVYISKNMWRIIFKASLLHSILIKQHLAKSRHSMMAVPLQPETQGKIFCILCGSLYIGKCITGDMLVTFHKFMKKAALNPNFMLALGMDDANVNLRFKNRSGYFC